MFKKTKRNTLTAELANKLAQEARRNSVADAVTTSLEEIRGHALRGETSAMIRRGFHNEEDATAYIKKMEKLGYKLLNDNGILIRVFNWSWDN